MRQNVFFFTTKYADICGKKAITQLSIQQRDNQSDTLFEVTEFVPIWLSIQDKKYIRY